jgi:alpha-ketoglutaric semialdehyde dehydrogenase
LQKTIRTCNNFIGGEWVPSSSNKTYEIRNPGDLNDVIGLFQESDVQDVREAWRLPVLLFQFGKR